MTTSSPKTVELNKKSVVVLFTVGAIMLVAPLSTVLFENSNCKADSYSCVHSEDYRYLVSAFPYVMLGGGVLIAFNMKRVSDYLNPPEDEREEGDLDDSTASYSGR
jgi:hypothetical protein